MESRAMQKPTYIVKNRYDPCFQSQPERQTSRTQMKERREGQVTPIETTARGKYVFLLANTSKSEIVRYSSLGTLKGLCIFCHLL